MEIERKCFGLYVVCPCDDECVVAEECLAYCTSLKEVVRLNEEITDLKSQMEGM